MKIIAISKFQQADAILLPIFEKQKESALKQLPKPLATSIAPIVKLRVSGKKGEIEVIHTVYKKKSLSIYMIGLGKANKATTNNIKHVGGETAQTIKKKKYNTVSIFPTMESDTREFLRFFTLGFLLGSYKFDNYCNEKDAQQHVYKEIQIISPKKEITPTELKELDIVTQAIYYTRDLVNTPPNEMTPTQLAKEAKAIAKLAPRQIKVTIFDDSKLKKHKMGLILGVGAGSDEPSRMIFMEYKNKPKNKKPIMFVGKGITFDAGGLNIKPTNHIEDMKSDMAGAASVLGLMRIVAALKPNLHIVGVISSAENLLGSKAMKPGDILTAYNGKTVEITNTDAEGRLVLGDALAYSTKKYKPEFVVDLATLTGACIAALGYKLTGVVSNNDKLVQKIEAASIKSCDQTWRLPLTENFKDKVKGDISDYKNWTANVNGGASMGAAFVEKFINKTTWAHLDIAGTSWTPENTPLSHRGATGEPVHLLWELVKDHA